MISGMLSLITNFIGSPETPMKTNRWPPASEANTALAAASNITVLADKVIFAATLPVESLTRPAWLPEALRAAVTASTGPWYRVGPLVMGGLLQGWPGWQVGPGLTGPHWLLP